MAHIPRPEWSKKAMAEVKEHFAKRKEEKDGFDSRKRWGNSAIKGMGVNSPAMMEARKGFQNSNFSSFSDRLLNSKFTGGIKLTVSELSSRLVNALAACDKLKNSSINDILCPDEKGNWTMVLNDSKVPFTLKDGQPLLNWDHKEKKEYQPWDEEPKVDGAWDEDLIGNCDEEGMANSKPK